MIRSFGKKRKKMPKENMRKVVKNKRKDLRKRRRISIEKIKRRKKFLLTN